jgi:hypothetical protein
VRGSLNIGRPKTSALSPLPLPAQGVASDLRHTFARTLAMNRLCIGLSFGILLCTAVAFGQQAELGAPAPVAYDAGQLPEIAPSMVSPEMYIYLQELRRHDDPAQAIRRRAEAKAAQRLSRLAALKWYGMSNSRPQASTVPMMGVYSPAWIGNGRNRYDWSGAGGVTVRLQYDATQR